MVITYFLKKVSFLTEKAIAEKTVTRNVSWLLCPIHVFNLFSFLFHTKSPLLKFLSLPYFVEGIQFFYDNWYLKAFCKMLNAFFLSQKPLLNVYKAIQVCVTTWWNRDSVCTFMFIYRGTATTYRWRIESVVKLYVF